MNNHSNILKEVLCNGIVSNMLQNKEMLALVMKKGFKGYESMNLEEITDMFVDLFGWNSYIQTIHTLKTPTNANDNDIINIKKVQVSDKTEYYGYFDASHLPHEGKGNKGIVAYAIKSSNGDLIVRDAFKVTVKDIFVGESLALLKLLDRAVELGIKDISVFGDNKSVVSLTKDNCKSQRRFTGYFPKIANRKKQFDNISIKWHNRENNKYADFLCRLARKGINVSRQGGSFNIEELKSELRRVGNAS